MTMSRVVSAAGDASYARNRLSRPWASLAALILATVWTLPTLGLLVTSFRPQRDIRRSGWWTAFSNPTWTLDNYRAVLSNESGSGLSEFFLNSLLVAIPSVIIPTTLAVLAAYAFAWIRFPGRDWLFILVFSLQVVPIQVTLIPLLTLYVGIGVAGTFWPIWISHTIFGLPLAIFLLHNFMREFPASLLEAARIDGAGHVAIFFRLLLPLLRPALAAFCIFQFLWVWNDLLVALTFAGGGTGVAPMTVALANLSGTRATDWHLLSAGAFVSIVVPVAVFLIAQRYFVRGLLSGSVKG